MINIEEVRKRHDQLTSKGIVNLSAQEREEFRELDVAVQRALKD